MSATGVRYSARCWSAQLTVFKSATGYWCMSLHRYSGKTRKTRSIVFVSGGNDLPRIELEQGQEPMLWLGGACIDFPPRILPSLRSFFEEHGVRA